jgi:predicted permease
MNTFLQDLRYGARSLLRSPGFTAVAAITLALGIGANTAIFSVVNAVLLKPLSYRQPDRLVALPARIGSGRLENVGASTPEFQDYKRSLPAVSELTAGWPININLTGSGTPERVQAAVVSPDYFSVLGVPPALGRNFTNADAGGKIGFVALISYNLWQRRFGGDHAVIGKTVRLDDDPMTIIGVMPKGFMHPVETGSSPVDLWAPIDLNNPDTTFINNRRQRVFDIVGRLAPGATIQQAQSELDALRLRMAEQYPDVYPQAMGWGVRAVPLAERVVGNVRPALLVLLGAVGFVLLIGCANVANLLLARATGRDREIAIRTALGGSRWRLIRQLLTESVLLAAVGGTLGLLIASWGTVALGHLAALYLPRAQEIGIDSSVLWFTTALIILTGIGFGLIPAIQASRPNLQGVLKESGRGSSSGQARTRTRAALVVVEVAVALMLLAGAGLLLRSFQRLLAVDPGFNPERLLTLQIWLPWPNAPEKGRYFKQENRLAFFDQALDAVRRVPAVTSVALTSKLPFRGRNNQPITIEGRPVAGDEAPPSPEFKMVSPSYFETMGIPLVQGRGLSETADSKTSGEAVINQTMAQKYWPHENPIGHRIKLGFPQAPMLTIVGVAGDVRQLGFDVAPREEMYVSYRMLVGLEMTMAVKTRAQPEEVSSAVTQAIRTVDPEQPVFGVMSMEQVIGAATAERRFSLLLLTLFAALALVLSSVGIYGVMAYTTTQRRHEIGIRMALGAKSADVLSLVLGQGMRLVGIGLGLGLVGAWILSRVLSSQLFGITARDPYTYAAVALLLAGVALTATYLPARRAARLDPMLALRSE